MAKQGNIKFGVQFQVDKVGLKTIEAELKKISGMSVKDVINPTSIKDATEKLNAAKTAATQMQQALEAGFNVKLNTVNLERFQQSLKDSGTSLIKLQADLSHVDGGNTAFRNMTAQLLTTNKHLKESSKLLTKMGETLSNTIRWSIASTAINSVTGSIQKAWSFTKQLDTSLNDIMIVTGKSADEMDRFAVKANKAAKELGASTKAYSDAALIYYQQGLDDTQAQARANVTVKAANVTGQDARAVSEQLTAVWNGYKVSAQEAELYIDKLAAVAASTAADLEELSTGMSRVASAANIMGVDIDQLNAQLATIVSVTREAPESIGTALKTVYARMSDLEAGLDAETTLGEYTKQMASFGFEALDANGKLRDMGDVVEEIGSRWNTLSRNQQVALAQTIAGTRQYSRMMSLFDNWNMYEEALKTSKGSAGTLQKQQDTYMESTEAHLEKLGATAEDLYASLFDAEGMNNLIDMLTKLVDGVDNFVEAIGGGAGVLRNFGSIAFNVFNKQIANSAARAVTNVQGFFDNQAQEKAQAQLLRDLDATHLSEEGVSKIVKLKKELNAISGLITEDEQKQGEEYIKQTAELYKQRDALMAQKKAIEETVRVSTSVDLKTEGWNQTSLMNAEADLSLTIDEITESLALFEQFEKELDDIEISLRKKEKRLATAQKRKDKGVQKRQLAQEDVEKWEGEVTRTTVAKIEGEDDPLSLSLAEDQLIQAQQRAAAAQQQINTARIEEEAANRSLMASIAPLKTAYDELIASDSTQIILTQKLSSEQQQKVTELQQVIEAYHSGSGTIDNYKQALRELTQILKDNGAANQEALNQLNTMMPKLDQANEKIKDLDDSVKYFGKDWNTKKLVSNITSVLGNVTNLVSALQTLGNLGDIWDNDDLTTGEKFAQTLTNVSMGLGMIAPMAIKAIGGIVAYTAAKKAQTIAEEASLLIKRKNASVEKLYQASQLLGLGLTKAQIAADKDSARASIEAAIGTLTQKNATDQETVSNWANVASWIAKHWYIGLIIAIIGALIAIIYLGVKAYNADAEAARKSAETAKALAESYQRVKEANEELKKSLSDYSEQQKALDEMTKGTKEWEDALRAANEQVLELLQKYPELVQYINRTSDGRLQIFEEGQEKILAKSEGAVATAGLMSTMAKVRATGKQLTSDTTNLIRDNNITSYDAASDTTAQVSTARLEGIIEKLSEKELSLTGLDAAGIQKLLKDELDISIDSTFAAGLEKASQEIDKMTVALEQNTDALRLSFEETAKDYYEAQGYDLGPNATAVTRAMSTTITKDKISDKIDDMDWDMDDDDFHEAYAEYMVETGQWQSYSNIDDELGSGAFTYVDAKGETHNAESVDDDQIMTAVASYQLMKESEATLPQAIDAVNTLAAMSGGNEELEFALTNLAGSQGEKVDLSVLTEKEVAAFQAQDLSKVDYKALGYDSLEELEKTRKASIDAYNTALTTYTDGLSETSKKAFDELLTKQDGIGEHVNKLTLQQKQKFAKLYEQMFDAAGEDGLQAFNEVLESAGEKSDELINLLTTETFDWASDDIQDDLQAKLDEANIELPEGFNFDELVESMRVLNGIDTGFNLAKTQESIAQIQGLVGSLNQQGDTISAEDYEALGDEAQSYFTQMADGTYMLTESVTGFSKAMKEYSKNKALKELGEEAKLLKDQETSLASLAKLNKDVNPVVAAKSASTAYQEAYDTYFSAGTDQTEATNKRVIKDWLLGNSSSAVNFKSNKNNQLAEGKTFETLTDAEWETYINERFYHMGGNSIEIYDDYEFQSNGHDISQLNLNDTTDDGVDILAHVAQQRGYSADRTASGLRFTNSSSMYQLSSNLNILKSLDVETLKNLGLTPSQVDDYIKQLDSIRNKGGALDATDVTTVNNISKIFKDISFDSLDTSSFTEGILNTLKQASSEEELAQWKQDFLTKFGYTNLDALTADTSAVAEAIKKAFNDTSLPLVVAKNHTEELLKNYESQLEAIEKINSEYEQMNSLLEHQRTLTELTYGEDAYTRMADILSNQITTIDAQLENSRKSAAYWQNQMNDALNQKNHELYEAAKANWEEASNNYYENMSQKIELLKEQYTNALKDAFKSAEESWSSNGRSLDYISTQWDIRQQYSDEYLDPVNAAFEKQKTENKFDTAINEAQSLNAQKKLRDLMESEMAILEDKDKLTEYDLKRAEARLEVTKAQIALEEAQANKSKMRLTRGADGTYSYQYVADVDAVTKAQQTLADAQQELYNLDVDEYEANLEKALDLYQDYKDRYLEIAQIADETERNAQMQLLKDEFGGLLEGILGDNADIKANLTASFGEAALGLGENFGNIEDVLSNVNSELADFVENINLDELDAELNSLTDPWIEINSLTDDWTSKLEDAKIIVQDIADTMAAATWNEDSLKTETYGWDPEKIGSSIVDQLKKTKITTVTDEATGEKTLQWVSAATGMYTGEWGPEGKVAMLHEKELVLNKTDTANILEAVDMVRNLENTLSASMLSSILSLMGGGRNSMAAWNLDKDLNLEQSVHITAEFPNVDSKAEIEAAFEELLNLATQQAFDTTRK